MIVQNFVKKLLKLSLLSFTLTGGILLAPPKPESTQEGLSEEQREKVRCAADKREEARRAAESSAQPVVGKTKRPREEGSNETTVITSSIEATMSFIRPNTGNYNDAWSCFLNSVCQALYHLIPFRSFMFATPLGQSATLDLLRAHFEIMRLATQPTHVNLSVSRDELSFREPLCSLINKFEMATGQHDAHEFFEAILETIKCEFTKGKHEESLKNLDSLNTITFSKTISCCNCETTSLTTDNSKEIQLTITSKMLEECLKAHLAPVELDEYECESCKESTGCPDLRVPATQIVEMIKTPKILTIQLRCFDFNHTTGQGEKIFDIVKTPDTITFGGSTYQLRSFIVHNGDTPGRGHYWTYVKLDQDNWQCYNDTNQKKQFSRNIKKEIPQAYLGQVEDPKLLHPESVEQEISSVMQFGKDALVAGITRAYLLFFEKVSEPSDYE